MKIVNRTRYLGLIFIYLLGLGFFQVASNAQAGTQGAFNLYLAEVRRDGLSNTVNLQNRQESLNFYQNVYLTSNGTANWSGSQASCNPGTTDASYKLAVLQRINYYRAMAGVPAQVTFSDESNRLAQAAALIMSANKSLNHNPPATWLCYSADGASGAGSSNLALGVSGWNAIALYMMDPGSNNSFAGHRRWILYPQTQVMGTGDVPGAGGYPSTNGLRIFDAHMGDPRPATREEFVAWPPPGYVPYPVVYARWSFSYAGADFSVATVGLMSGGTSWSVNKAAPATGYGENTLVWIPNGMSNSAAWPKPGSDTAVSVSVHNVKINGQLRDFNYDVIIFDPGP